MFSSYFNPVSHPKKENLEQAFVKYELVRVTPPVISGNTKFNFITRIYSDSSFNMSLTVQPSFTIESQKISFIENLLSTVNIIASGSSIKTTAHCPC